MSKVLLTFVGFHDPHHKGAIEGEELKGPILYLLGLRSFDRVYLLTGPNTLAIARATAEAIAHDHPRTEAVITPIDMDDPISYSQIISGVRKAFRKISGENDSAEYFIATASGTPQMHAAWLLLASSGEIPAVVLQTRPPQFVTTERQAVETIDLRSVARELGQERASFVPSDVMRADLRFTAAEETPAPRYKSRARPREEMFDASLRVLERAAPEAPSSEELLRDELGIVGKHPAFLEALQRPHSSPAPRFLSWSRGKQARARSLWPGSSTG